MKKFLILFVFLLNVKMYERVKMEIAIIPFPQEVVFYEGYFSIPANFLVKFNSKEAEQIYNQLEKKISSTGRKLKKSKNENLELILDKEFAIPDISPELNDESYKLTVDKEKIKIISSNIRGLFYGFISLIQLIESSENNKIACMEITDYPNMKIRGISDDIARGQVSTVDNFKKIIDFLAQNKMNTYMIYIEDVIELKSYPTIGKNRGALTHNEIKEILSYANENFIDVIPIFQTLGHYENILTQEEFVDLAEFPGGATLSVTEEKTYEFLENSLKEIFELFPSKYIHIGADESWDVGLGKSKKIVAETSLAKVHAEHYKRVYDICTKYGKKVMMYGDIILNHPKILQEIPKDIIIVDWHYRPDYFYPSTVTFSKYGFQYIVSPSVWNFLTIYPANFNAIPNIIRLTNDGIQNNSIGMINSNWGDYGAETFKENIYYGYAWSAQCAWNYSSSDVNRFTQEYIKHFYGIYDYRLVEIYDILNDPNGLTTWHEFWRHPLLPFRENTWWEVRSTPYSKILWLDSRLNKAKSYINETKKLVTKNQEHLDVLELVVDLMLYYKTKLETQQYLHAKLKLDTNIEIDSLEKTQLENFLGDKNLSSMIDNNVSEIKKLQERFKSLWLKYYKPDNLNMIMDKFNRLVSYFNETQTELNGKLTSPEIKSKWIYNQTENDEYSNEIVFEKTFYLSDTITSAKAQLLADSYGELYINDNYVGRVFARRSGSLLVDYRRILFRDIKEFLIPGFNRIKIISRSWERKPKAGINFIAEIKTVKENIEIISDKNWLAKNINDESFANSSVVELPYRMIVTKPNFEKDRSSWIER